MAKKTQDKPDTNAGKILCKIPEAPTISRKQYAAAIRRAKRGSLKTARARSMSLTYGVGYEPPHSDYPAYGAPCYMEARAEMMAWVDLAEAADAYVASQTATYMPPWKLLEIANAYTAAMAAYNAAWYGLETCLSGTLV